MIKYLGILFRAIWYIVRVYPRLCRYANPKKKSKYSLDERYALSHEVVKKVVKYLHVELHVKGEENLPKDTNYLLIPNHQSNMDPLILLNLYDRDLSFIAKKEVENFPLVNKVVIGIDGVLMDRKDIRSEVRAISKASEILSSGKVVFAIFPEGTRSKDPNHTLLHFKPGALKPAFNASKPIVPVAVYGGFRVLDKKLRMKRYPVQISFLKPIYPEEFENKTTSEVMEKVRSEVEAEVDILRQNDKILTQKYNKKGVNLDIKGI